DGGEVLLRFDMQRTGDRLLPLEQFAIGGANSVRGYRENFLVRDGGMVASAELRWPVAKVGIPYLPAAYQDGTLRLAAFSDWGRATNNHAVTGTPGQIYSIGAGVLWSPASFLHGQLYWGHKLRSVADQPTHDLQDSGIHFRVTLAFN